MGLSTHSGFQVFFSQILKASVAQGPSLTGAQLPVLGLFVSVPVRISVGKCVHAHVCGCVSVCMFTCICVYVYGASQNS